MFTSEQDKFIANVEKHKTKGIGFFFRFLFASKSLLNIAGAFVLLFRLFQ